MRTHRSQKILFVVLCVALGACARLSTAVTGDDLVVCPSDSLNSDCQFSSISDAANWARWGNTIVVRPGVYREPVVLLDSGVTIRADPGAHIKSAAAEGKAAIVVKGNDTTIVGLECSDVRVRDKNGACVRLEGRNLTLRNVYFHDSEQGLITSLIASGSVLIEDSRFERLGRNGRAHGIYVNELDELTVRRTHVLSTKDEGHGVKSRAVKTVIEDSVIASVGGDDSRLIDISNGGEVIIRNNVLQEGPNSVNYNLIGVGLEGIKHANNSVLIEGNIIISDHDKPLLMHLREPIAPVYRNNTLIGGEDLGGTNSWYPNRDAAGIPPYPDLPTLPNR